MDIKLDETIAKYFKELMSSGWISRTTRMKDGRPSGYFDYTLYFEPIIPATTEKAETVKAQLPQNSSFSNTDSGNNTKNNNTPPLSSENNSSHQIFEAEEWLQIAVNSNLAFSEPEKISIKDFANHIFTIKNRKRKSLTVLQIENYLNDLSKFKASNFDICSIIQDTITLDYELLIKPSFRHQTTGLNSSLNNTPSKSFKYPCADYISPQNTSEKKSLCGYIDSCYRNKLDPRTGRALTNEQMSLLRTHFSQDNRGNIGIYEYIYQEEVLKNKSLLEQSLNDIPASFVNVESNKSDSHNKDE